MQMIDHFIDLHGPGAWGRFARPEAVGAVLSRIKPAVRESVRMRVLGSSRKVGRPLKELSAAWDVRCGGQEAGPDDSTRLLFQAPTLEEAAPRIFEQGNLFEDRPSGSDTAFDLFGDVLADVADKRRESSRFDADLLRSVAAFGTSMRRSVGVKSIHVRGHRLDQIDVPAIDREVTNAADELLQQTPQPRRVRVAGLLNMLRVSDRAFELVLKDEQRLRAVWAEQSVVQLRGFLGSQVVVEGNVVFRPSGSVLRIDAEAIASAGDKAAFFSRMPTPANTARRQAEPALGLSRGKNGFAAIYGQWPGEESEEDLIAAVEELS